jgi:cellulose biosynthesis protein BcsQ
MKAKKIAVYSGKGGTGKTTLTDGVATKLREQGKRVLLVDCDGSQPSLTGKRPLPEMEKHLYIYDAITALELRKESDPKLAAEAKRTALSAVHFYDEGFGILPNDGNLIRLEHELASWHTKRERVLRNFFTKLFGINDRNGNPILDFDYILLDCPASEGLIALNALVAADLLLVPVEPSDMVIHAVKDMLSNFYPTITGRKWADELNQLGLSGEKWGVSEEEELDDEPIPLNPNLQIGAVIPFKFNRTSAFHQRNLKELENLFGDLPSEEGKAFIPPEGAGILMPPVPYSTMYDAMYNNDKSVNAGLVGYHYGHIWSYIASQVVLAAERES